MTQKKLQKNSILNEYDLDGDDLITDEELERAKQIKETETKLRKNLAQLRMARYTLIGMGVFTLAMFGIPIPRVEALAEISSLFYISGAGIVGTYMGTSAYMQKNGK
jgi:hypothetical protein